MAPVEQAVGGANHRLWIELIGKPDTRSKVIMLNAHQRVWLALV